MNSRPTSRRYRRAFVVGAYHPNGGTRMAYHLGCILERDFGIPATAVQIDNEAADHGIYQYDLRMPQIPLAALESAMRADDVLIVNPSFSRQQFGWRLPGFKLSYVQDFKTFVLLDRKFDHYVAVSDFVRDFLRCVYDLDVRVIPPFVPLDEMPAVVPWAQRPSDTVLVSRKGLPEIWNLSFAAVRDAVARRAPQIRIAEPIAARGQPQRDLLARIGAARYLLMLSAGEGFGLLPLEAMALGTLVVGYDGFGGRHYLHDGVNCRVAPYPQIERVIDLLIDAVQAPARSEAIAASGRETAAAYSYARYREAWIDEFSRALRIEPTAT